MFFETPFKAKKIEKKGKCPLCEKENIRLTRDHIIPKIYGGVGLLNNIQHICALCNSSRGSRIDLFIWQKMNFQQRLIFIKRNLRRISEILKWRTPDMLSHDQLLDIWYDLKTLSEITFYDDDALVRDILIKMNNCEGRPFQ